MTPPIRPRALRRPWRRLADAQVAVIVAGSKVGITTSEEVARLAGCSLTSARTITHRRGTIPTQMVDAARLMLLVIRARPLLGVLTQTLAALEPS